MAERSWPKAPAIYQIYPRSFMDSDGDGIGDLNGITSRLGHVADLGVDAIWLSPHYVSPWDDGGYDIVDHAAVEPRLGTMEDFDRLVARAHDLGLRIIVDQVLNHTSCDHPWFLAALDGNDEMAERYLFRDAKPDGSPPNNWLSFFGYAGWSWSHKRKQFHFHQFLPCQPSLNLRHPVVQAVHRDQIAFWRARGVDGFRFDAVTSYLWDESLKDNPPASPEVSARVTGAEFNRYTFQDHVYDMLPGDGADYAERLRQWAGDDAWLVGEINSGNRSHELAMRFSEPGRLDAAYTTDLPESGASPSAVAAMIAQSDLARAVTWLSSHDQPRHNKSGSPEEAAFFALLMAVLPGPWLIYQGEEWGLPQPHLERSEVTDPHDLKFWPDGPGREGARVPMPWDPDAATFGFTEAAPWLPMRWNKTALGAAQAPGGTADIYRQLLSLRREREWAEGSVVGCRHGETWLDLTIETRSGSDRAWFGYAAGAERPAAAAGGTVFALPGSGSGAFRAAVWPLE